MDDNKKTSIPAEQAGPEPQTIPAAETRSGVEPYASNERPPFVYQVWLNGRTVSVKREARLGGL